ncbi:MAG: hypothetical protein LQ338_004341 [Usnochroma carphineum]|nr:MAG: hypothetical protein LQ338_004341 [Usnochroma carphineum]
MQTIFDTFHRAQAAGSGPLLSSTLTPIPPPHDPFLLHRFYKSSRPVSIHREIQFEILARPPHLSKAESTAWIDIYVAYWKAIGEILRAESRAHGEDWAIKVYEAWKDLTNLLIRGYSHAGFAAWTMPCLYTAGKYLRIFAIKADEEQAAKVRRGEVKMEGDALLGDDIMATTPGFEKNERLEDAARVINRMFTLCISDRAPIEESRKWGLYYTTNLLFKTYFKLNSVSLSKNCLRALEAARTDMPPMEAFPKSHIVTFKYYVGVIHFLDEEYHRKNTSPPPITSATNTLTGTKSLSPLSPPPPSPPQNPKNYSPPPFHRLLLTYLIPTHLHTTLTLPSPSLPPQFSPIHPLFSPLLQALRAGNLSAFSAALALNESVYVNRRIYLSLERARDLCLRNLLRKTWLMQGGKENTRVKISLWARGVRWSMMDGGGGTGEEGKGDGDEGKGMEMEMEDEEVECLIAGLIYKGLLKGYISREHATVVLNRKGEAFPGTGV